MKFQGESKSLRETIWGLINNYAKKHFGQPTTASSNQRNTQFTNTQYPIPKNFGATESPVSLTFLTLKKIQ